MPPSERIARICALLDDAFLAEAFADHVVRVAAARDAARDAPTADALRTIARCYRVRALRAWVDIACLNARDPASGGDRT